SLLTPRFVFSSVASTTALSTLSLHDALPICSEKSLTVSEPGSVRIEFVADDGSVEVLKDKTTLLAGEVIDAAVMSRRALREFLADRKSTRLNSSHVKTSYAVFCLKKTTTLRL